MENFFMQNEYLVRLALAMFLGMILGVERVVAHKTAGMRTYALVAMGSALFVTISEILFLNHGNTAGFDPTRLASQIISGIGFLGAGLIIFKDSKLSGLTTATGIWVSAGIGMATGFGFFSLAIGATVLTLFIFIVLWYVEQSIKKVVDHNDPPQNLND
jgi:putative Mg2+ transporter-C (MgtC) family protein